MDFEESIKSAISNFNKSATEDEKDYKENMLKNKKVLKDLAEDFYKH